MAENHKTQHSIENKDQHTSNYQSIVLRKPTFTIPLILKKQNSIEKYVNVFKSNKKTNLDHDLDSSQINQRRSKIRSGLSNKASYLLSNKLTPDIIVNELKDSYVKYVPVKDQKTQSRMQILDKMEIQYNRLKNNIQGKKDSSLGKYPEYQKPKSQHKQIKSFRKFGQKQDLPPQKIQKQLKKTKIEENGKTYFADLYMIKKNRQKMKKQLSANRTFAQSKKEQQDTIYVKPEEQVFVAQKMKKQLTQKKQKMMKKRGLHWNVYYQMLALTEIQKKNIKSSNSKFYHDFKIHK